MNTFLPIGLLCTVFVTVCYSFPSLHLKQVDKNERDLEELTKLLEETEAKLDKKQNENIKEKRFWGNWGQSPWGQQNSMTGGSQSFDPWGAFGSGFSNFNHYMMDDYMDDADEKMPFGNPFGSSGFGMDPYGFGPSMDDFGDDDKRKRFLNWGNWGQPQNNGPSSGGFPGFNPWGDFGSFMDDFGDDYEENMPFNPNFGFGSGNGFPMYGFDFGDFGDRKKRYLWGNDMWGNSMWGQGGAQNGFGSASFPTYNPWGSDDGIDDYEDYWPAMQFGQQYGMASGGFNPMMFYDDDKKRSIHENGKSQQAANEE